jgi:choline-sulfatase
MMAVPGVEGRLVTTPVSTLDVTPTLAGLAGIDISTIADWTDGEDLMPLATGTGGRGIVPMEYAAEGTVSPMIGLRNERYKLTLCEADPPILADLEADPYEMTNLAEDPAAAELLATLTEEAARRWDLSRFDGAVRESQARRHIVYTALRNGAYFPWDYQPLQKASERYMRNHMDLNILEESQRFPRGE